MANFYDEEELIITTPSEVAETTRKDIAEVQMFKSGDFRTTSSQSEKAQQDIRAVLSTQIGHRFMRNLFGSRVPEQLFEQNDEVLASTISYYGKEAINRCIDYLICDSILIDTTSQPSYALLKVYYHYKDSGIQSVADIPLVRKIAEDFDD